MYKAYQKLIKGIPCIWSTPLTVFFSSHLFIDLSPYFLKVLNDIYIRWNHFVGELGPELDWCTVICRSHSQCWKSTRQLLRFYWWPTEAMLQTHRKRANFVFWAQADTWFEIPGRKYIISCYFSECSLSKWFDSKLLWPNCWTSPWCRHASWE